MNRQAKTRHSATSDATTKRERKLEYHRNYYKQRRVEIRNQQRQGYEQKYHFASADLLRHLKEQLGHALGKFEVCAE